MPHLFQPTELLHHVCMCPSEEEPRVPGGRLNNWDVSNFQNWWPLISDRRARTCDTKKSESPELTGIVHLIWHIGQPPRLAVAYYVLQSRVRALGLMAVTNRYSLKTRVRYPKRTSRIFYFPRLFLFYVFSVLERDRSPVPASALYHKLASREFTEYAQSVTLPPQ